MLYDYEEVIKFRYFIDYFNLKFIPHPKILKQIILKKLITLKNFIIINYELNYNFSSLGHYYLFLNNLEFYFKDALFLFLFNFSLYFMEIIISYIH